SILAACGAPVEPELTMSAGVVAPAERVGDLRVTGSTSTVLSLEWTQVSDGTGSAAYYRVKYSEPHFHWKTATIGCDRTIKGTSIGEGISCRVEGLEPGTAYELQLMSFRTVNGVWQGAVYSNVARGSTLAGLPDAPREVTDLTVTEVTASEISLSWTQVDDGTGNPAWYRVKYAAPSISWKTATIGCDRSIPGAEIGAEISCTVEGLRLGTTYDIQLMSYRLVDGVWRDARYSNIATATTTGAGLAVVSMTDRIPLRPLSGQAGVDPLAVNDLGHVVGTSGGLPVRWESGTAIQLAVFGGTRDNVPSSINTAGQIVGRAERVADGADRVLLWEDGTVTDIGTLPGHFQSRGTINAAGHIVGTAFNTGAPSSSESESGFVWLDGAMTALPPVPGDENTAAVAGNSSGLVVGITSNLYEEPDDPRDEWRFVVWQDGEVIWLQGSSSPSPLPDGNEAWLGVTEAGDAYITNTDVGGLWRWRDGQVAPWPGSSANDANASAVSPGGLVLGGTIVRRSGTTPASSTFGIWKDERFYAFEEQTLHCQTLSDEYVVCAYRTSLDEWFLGRMSFQDGT
ncbi:MAG: fibronectin type III domain-containing protein, partial [Gemmatimonadota bacterium]